MAIDIRTLFNEQDLAQIRDRGSDLEVVEQQVKNFHEGFPFMDIQKAATVDDGIIRLEEAEIRRLVGQYEDRLKDLKIEKFVPASGAASRMFKALFACMSEYDGSEAAWEKVQEEGGLVKTFFEDIEKFAFYQDLDAQLQGQSIKEALDKKDLKAILEALLTEEGLGCGQLPKGLLKFHKYPEGDRTPAEEHLVEAANYAAVHGGKAFIHFTVSPEHKTKFEELMSRVKADYESKYKVELQVSYSIQKPSTDTIAVDMDNQPFRLNSGEILFRPGGHGALIENLNDIDADIIFIKNIDNVVPDRIKDDTITFKKALAGILLETQEQVFAFQERLEGNPGAEEVDEALAFVENVLCVQPPQKLYGQSHDEKLSYVKAKLERPIRVCGMVKNEGEPGGGPFWAKNSDGTTSLQIVESAQIDKNNDKQLSIMQNATHFNPVDLVCATRDRQGKPWNLLDYRDEKTGFIAYKSKEGRDLKAQELPGLWNGAMADWTTLFVEVPIITFNPVKTVNDLLRHNHQPSA